MCSIDSIKSAVREVLSGRDVREAWLFGSFARGEETDESDVDLRLVCGPTIRYGDLYRISLDLGKRLNRRIDIVTNPIERMRPTFRDRVLADQVMIYAAA